MLYSQDISVGRLAATTAGVSKLMGMGFGEAKQEAMRNAYRAQSSAVWRGSPSLCAASMTVVQVSKSGGSWSVGVDSLMKRLMSDMIMAMGVPG